MQPTYRYHNGGAAAEETVLELARHDVELSNVIKEYVVKDEWGAQFQREEQLCEALRKKKPCGD